MTADMSCECTEEYGPCELHGELLAQREGASTRTADELCEVFILDMLGEDPACLSPFGASVFAEAQTALAESSWIEDADLAEGLRDLCHQVEAYFADLWITWDDGYLVVRPTADCPLIADVRTDGAL